MGSDEEKSPSDLVSINRQWIKKQKIQYHWVKYLSEMTEFVLLCWGIRWFDFLLLNISTERGMMSCARDPRCDGPLPHKSGLLSFFCLFFILVFLLIQSLDWSCVVGSVFSSSRLAGSFVGPSDPLPATGMFVSFSHLWICGKRIQFSRTVMEPVVL